MPEMKRWMLAPGGSTKLHVAVDGKDQSLCGIALSEGRTERINEVQMARLKPCQRCAKSSKEPS